MSYIQILFFFGNRSTRWILGLSSTLTKIHNLLVTLLNICQNTNEITSFLIPNFTQENTESQV